MVKRRNLLIALGTTAAAGAGLYLAAGGSDYEDAVRSTWIAKPADTSAELEYLVHYAVLAANSHNTQPWHFTGSKWHIRSSSGLAIFISHEDNRDHWVRAGRSYQRFALQATSLGIRNAFINQPVEVPAFRAAFSKWLGLTGGRPDFIVRYG